jgi:hypothetical protein
MHADARTASERAHRAQQAARKTPRALFTYFDIFIATF